MQNLNKKHLAGALTDVVERQLLAVDGLRLTQAAEFLVLNSWQRHLNTPHLAGWRACRCSQRQLLAVDGLRLTQAVGPDDPPQSEQHITHLAACLPM
jgi:phosphoglycerate dehydrogenase-like enzyme